MAANRPWILGVSSSHNGSACLLHGDEIAVAIQEERLVRFKRAGLSISQPSASVSYCLDAAGISSSDLSAVVYSSTLPRSAEGVDSFMGGQLHETLSSRSASFFRVTHHLAHAIGAFALSGFQNCAILVVDGNGTVLPDLDGLEHSIINSVDLSFHNALGRTIPREIISIYTATGSTLTPVCKHISSVLPYSTAGMKTFGSLGDMYGRVGSYLFGSFFDGPGKTMGLAPFGKPIYSPESFFSIQHGLFRFHQTVPQLHRMPPTEKLWQETIGQDLAASVQAALEHALLYLVELSAKLTTEMNLAYSGGVALNSVANEKLVRSRQFEKVSIMAAAEDSGIAVGAAFHGLWALSPRSSYARLDRDSMGRTYLHSDILRSLKAMPWLTASKLGNVPVDTAQLLAQGEILGWFHGRSELGPRSLGHRSIICDSRSADAKETLNARVKHRESFRPFAPMIPLEEVSRWFDTRGSEQESPFMLRAMTFNHRASQVPAVVHVDNTGRVQTVTKIAEPLLYELLRAFECETGVPILLNTSFNLAGEPIVETPYDALWCLTCTHLDGCVIEGLLVRKLNPFLSPLDLFFVSATTTAHIEEDESFERVPTPIELSYIFCGVDGSASRAEARRLFPHSRLLVTLTNQHGYMLAAMSPHLLLLLSLCQLKCRGYDITLQMNAELQWWTEDHSLSAIGSLARIGALQAS